MLNLSLTMGLSIIIIAFMAEFMDSSLGMGYGTSLTSILLLLGFKPLQIVPAILLSEFVTGILAGMLHNRLGNADFSLKTISPFRIRNAFKKYGIAESFARGVSLHGRIVILIGTCSIIGAFFGACVALNLPSFYLSLYIGVLVLGIGIYIILTLNSNLKFSWKKLGGIAAIASFNKGISGGGYGPVVTGGQILSGMEGRNAVAVTSLAEGITCIVGLIVYAFSAIRIDWVLAPYLLIGGVMSIPLSGLVVKKINTRYLRLIIGVGTAVLGCVTLIKIFL